MDALTLGSLTDAAFAAVKGVFLIGDPVHKAGLACNVDLAGGNSTFDVDGVYVAAGLKTGIPSDWIPKTLDVCNYVSLVFLAGLSRGILGFITDWGALRYVKTGRRNLRYQAR